jgi:pimeloyl-ACP methyl ester carboxylesterase
MLKPAFTFFLLLITAHSFSQAKTIIYCFPGQGSDRRIFDSLRLCSDYDIEFIEYGTPEKHATMHSFARQLAGQIDTTRNFILLGVSLGGMICSELSEILKPEKTILISSAKNRGELPFRYKFQKAIPIYKLVPGAILLASAKVLQPIVEPDRNKNKSTFKSMLRRKEHTYMRRSVDLIIQWDRKENSSFIYHLHGSHDHTLPIRNITPSDVVKGGSHMMTLTRGEEVSVLVNRILEKE